MLEFSNFLIDTHSFDNKYGLLYNMKNEYFIRYDLKDFKNKEELLESKDVCEYLNSKEFFKNENENENETIEKMHNSAVKSAENMMLILKISKKCNFKCIYCYESLDKKEMDDHTMEILLLYIENELKKGLIKKLNISWFGGEPLINYYFIEKMAPRIIDICKKYNVEYNSSVTTNGYLLNKDMARKLIKLGVKLFQITLDGPASIHNMQRVSKNGNGTYAVIKNNLYDLSSIDGEFIVVLRTNVSKKMLNYLDDYVNDIKDLFNDKRFYAKYHAVVNFEIMEHDVTDLELVDKMINAMHNGLRFPLVKEYLSPSQFYCYASKENHFVIDSECNVSKCTEVNEKYSFIGKINEYGKLIMNNNMLLWKIAKYSEKCANCNDYISCDGGVCPLFYLKHGQGRCMNFKLEKEILLKIAELQNSYNTTIHL